MAAPIRSIPPAFTAGSVVAPMAGISADARIRPGEVAWRRPGLAESHRAKVSLRNSAAADVDRLVHPSTAAFGPTILDRPRSRDRVAVALPHFCASPITPNLLRGFPLSASPDSINR